MIIEIDTSKKYNIEIKPHLLDTVGEKLLALPTLSSPCKVCIITDTNVERLYLKKVTASLLNCKFDVCNFVVDAGEASKNIKTIEKIVNFLAEKHFTKEDIIVALGGGVVGDISGFVASVFLRGIPYVQVPTTLLAGIDSSIGGKTAVNLHSGKNLVGSFYQPSAVFFDTKALETLKRQELMDGISEMIKAGIIADTALFTLFENNQPQKLGQFLYEAIVHAINVKKHIVEADENEHGIRTLLNLGHTVGHAVEICSNYKISHGNAVAIGLFHMVKMASKTGILSEPDLAERLSTIYKKYGFDVNLPFSPTMLASVASNDKKRSGNTIKLVLPVAVGKCVMKDFAACDLAELFDV